MDKTKKYINEKKKGYPIEIIGDAPLDFSYIDEEVKRRKYLNKNKLHKKSNHRHKYVEGYIAAKSFKEPIIFCDTYLGYDDSYVKVKFCTVCGKYKVEFGEGFNVYTMKPDYICYELIYDGVNSVVDIKNGMKYSNAF